MRNWEVLDFIATTENSVINILLLLNPKPAATERKINSIPAETRTVLKLYLLLRTPKSKLSVLNKSWLP